MHDWDWDWDGMFVKSYSTLVIDIATRLRTLLPRIWIVVSFVGMVMLWLSSDVYRKRTFSAALEICLYPESRIQDIRTPI